jgi:hypothetical protein
VAINLRITALSEYNRKEAPEKFLPCGRIFREREIDVEIIFDHRFVKL